jgi:hypothetical protein
MDTKIQQRRRAAQLDAHNLTRRGTHQDLPAIRRVHHPSGAVDGRTEVVAIALVTLPGVKSHSHPQHQTLRPSGIRQSGLRLDRRAQRRVGPRERSREAVSPRGKHHATARADRRSQDRVVGCERRIHRIGLLVPADRRSLDIREEEGHRP